MKTNKNCQSCGMPLKKNPEGGGAEKDGSRSKMYCSYCYENGEFKNPEITADEMQILVKDKLKEMGFPGFLAGMFAKRIPKLERWKKT
ncbi:MAG: hypothetical protein GXO89_04650 [Chlorobi bacterium]|nr:hypothetical protein [Chlorobiota bacterium]